MRERKIGTITMGVCLVVFGVLFLVHIFGGFLNYELIFHLWPLILIGLFMNGSTALFLINLGILAFSASVLFQLVTLPVEYNASGRAIKMLQETGILAPEEVRDAKRVLSAAALTYVAGAASSLLQLFRLILIGGRRRND